MAREVKVEIHDAIKEIEALATISDQDEYQRLKTEWAALSRCVGLAEGRKVEVLLDHGGSRSFMDAGLARSLGLSIKKTTSAVHALFGKANVTSGTARVRVQIGEAKYLLPVTLIEDSC